MFRSGGSSRGRQATSDQLMLLQRVAEAFHRGKYKTRVENGSEVPLPSRRRFPAAYADYLTLSEERGLKPRSSRTLRRELKRYSIEKSERNRRGARAAYRYSSPQGRLSDLFLSMASDHSKSPMSTTNFSTFAAFQAQRAQFSAVLGSRLCSTPSRVCP